MRSMLDEDDAAHQPVAVIGAGTMGAGIAQVAAAAGHPVLLLDLRQGVVQGAIEQISRGLAGLVEKGRLTEAERRASVARLAEVHTLAEMADAALVVEVIVENLDSKRMLMREMDAIVAPHAVLASNTSSISITAIANGLKHPRRVVGMHFFNPVPQMKLVEVVAGVDTDPAVAQAVAETARRWGKTPVHATSTPGFIVNRIARPYYAETLALLQEQAATPAELDALARSAGFRMGPCELMDLIGHDVNFAVTESVFEANFGDRRYAPSLVQKTLLEGGRLGRKAGKGFYDGVPAPDSFSVTLPPELPPLPAAISVMGGAAMARALAAALDQRGIVFARDESAPWSGLAMGEVEIHVTDGRTATQRAAERHNSELAVIDLPPVADKLRSLGVAFAAGASVATRDSVIDALLACGWQPQEMRDTPGLWSARTVCMLVNEAADAVHQGVCDEAGADLAMKLGTNWPVGPFEWLGLLGVEYTVTVLDHLFVAYRSERYRVSPLLQQQAWAGRMKPMA